MTIDPLQLHVRPYAGPGPFDPDGDGAIRSALRRFPVAAVMVDERRNLVPLNRAAADLFYEEALERHLLETYCSHPIARLIRAVDAGNGPERLMDETVVFPSGSQYRVMISASSDSGEKESLLLLVQPLTGERADATELFDRWGFTLREREIASHLMRGLSTREICDSACIAVNTLRTHIRHILEKSGTSSRAGFVARAHGEKPRP